MKESESLKSTELSTRAVNALASVGITTIEELIKSEEKIFYTVKGLGKKSVEDIFAFIVRFRDDNF